MNISRLARLSLVAILVLVSVLGSLAYAIPAQAAQACRTWYVIQDGDTTAKIAHLFDLRWREIARANNLTYPYKLRTIERLCIPSDDTIETQNKPATTMTASTYNNRLSITATGGSNKSMFYVRVRDVSTSVGKWYKLGSFKVNKKSTGKAAFIIPKELRSAIYLEVCLKNAVTDDAFCKTVLRRYY